jgi:periplasmic copper chaperone A
VKTRLSALVLSLLVTPAFAAGLTVSDAWFRALPGTLPSGGYFTLHNGGNKPVSLNGASSPACGMLMLHKSETESGVSSMEMIDGIDVPAGATVQFAPGGYHLMCMDPKMKPGTKAKVTLSFTGGANVTADFAVKDAKGQ